MKTLLVTSLFLGLSAFAQEQANPIPATPVKSAVKSSGEIETSCRIKAKEIAAETYRTCVTDQKNTQIEQIKKEYQAKLKALKSHYESELKKMSGKAAADKAENKDDAAAIPAEDTSKDSVKEVAPVQPQDATSIQQPTEEKKVYEGAGVEVIESTVPDQEVKSPEIKKAAKDEYATPAVDKDDKSSDNNPNDNVAKSLPTKKPLKATKKVAAKAVSKKANLKKTAAAKNSPSEMTVQLKPTTKKKALSDDSTMDLPEPIPVENVSGAVGSSI